MKNVLGVLIVSLAMFCHGVPSTNSFVAVTNDWYHANFSNVYELAQQRLSNNSNDVVAAYLMLEWKTSFGTVADVSNAVTRVIQLSDAVTNTTFTVTYSKLRQACLDYRDEFLPSLTDQEVEAERYKAYLPNSEMVNSELLRLLDLSGLW